MDMSRRRNSRILVEEMSFYGDLFNPNQASMYACAGKGPQGACYTDMGAYKAQRSCDEDEDEDEPCMVQVPGPCHPSYLEVVTVYMKPSDFEDYYDCDDIDLLGIGL